MAILHLRAVKGQISLEARLTPSIADDSFQVSLPETLTEHVQDLDEIKWFMESYARQDSFSWKRAQAAELILRSYGSSLATAICASDAVRLDLYDSELLILVVDPEEYCPRLSRVHWEMLENVEFWDADLRPRRVLVVRQASGAGPIDHDSYAQAFTKRDSTQQHVLALSARPLQERDIPHRLITRSILSVVAEEQDRSPTPPTFGIIRPGTFQALETALEDHDFGYYDIVHFDLHGMVLHGSAFLRFLRSNEDLIGVDEVPLSKVAELLAKHGVRIVILNACQSASEEGPFSNVARSIVQNGVLMAIGMRYEILDSAAEIFTKTLYRQLLRHKQTLWEAAPIARLAMRTNPHRWTRFNTQVDVQDYITPVLFSRSDLILMHKPTSEAAATEMEVPHDEMNLFGRESDLISVETKLVNSNVLLLNGSAGAGKTHFMQHVCWWWKATGFVEDFVFIDCAKLGNLNVVKVQAAIAFAFSLATSEETTVDVVSYLNLHRCLLVIDSVDAARLDDEAQPRDKQLGLRRFLRKIKKSFVVLTSRHDEHWVKAAAKVTYYLNHLDMKSSLQLATKEATDNRYGIDVKDTSDARFLEQCIFLVDGNPLAIILIIRVCGLCRTKIKHFYNNLTDGSVLDELQPGILAESRSRGFIDAQKLVRLHSGSGPAPVRDVDFRLLAPFWRSFPLDLAPYRLFFLRTKARISNHDVPYRTTYIRQYLTERFTGSERSILCSKKAFAYTEITSLTSMADAFSTCERQGFLSRITPSTLADGETHMKIHPLMTLALRQKEFALPQWMTHAVEVAYQRFWVYRSRHWPSRLLVGSSGEVALTQLSYDFANYVTASTFSFRVKADHPNVYFLRLPIQMAFSIVGNTRRMHVVLDILERLLATFGTPLAEEKPTMLLSTWSSAFSMLKKKTKILKNDIFSDARGMLEEICMLAIQFAASFADLLGIENDYFPLLEGIARNLLPHSNSKDVSLLFLKVNRIRLLHNKNHSSDVTKAMTEALGISEARLRETRKDNAGFRSATAPFTHDTQVELRTADGPEEIARVGQKLLNILEDQLDGVDTARIKALIYDGLAGLAIRRLDFSTALHHLDTAIRLSDNSANTTPQEIQSLLDTRNSIPELEDTHRQG